MSETQVPLADLLNTTVDALLDAQDKLDEYATTRSRRFQEVPPGEPVLPPLWFNFDNIDLELSLLASVQNVRVNNQDRAEFLAATAKEADLALYGSAVQTGLTLRMSLQHHSQAAIKEAPVAEQEPQQPENEDS
ncbi:hypothetical protein P886_1073 [Alteromonadaceae bacterium 2753L.S.0a.02]|nr:hypothetical protein P886_1073 [Alteromonadaceae bacterium 2753L.S.0a.02]